MGIETKLPYTNINQRHWKNINQEYFQGKANWVDQNADERIQLTEITTNGETLSADSAQALKIRQYYLLLVHDRESKLHPVFALAFLNDKVQDAMKTHNVKRSDIKVMKTTANVKELLQGLVGLEPDPYIITHENGRDVIIFDSAYNTDIEMMVNKLIKAVNELGAVKKSK